MDGGITSDEQWLIEKALSLLKNDPYAAKSWLLTGRTLFPRNFQIQYQAYRMEKLQKNAKKVALMLEEMLLHFPQEIALWEDIQQVIDMLQTDTQDDKTNFLKEVFDALPPHLQCHVLLKVADTQKDVLQKCRLVMLVLQRHPDRVTEQGISLIESLIAAEKNHHMSSPVNCYRKYLVYDVLPLVLKAPLKVSHNTLLLWLQKTMEFYVTYITQPPTPDMLMSPKSAGISQSGMVGSRRASVQGMGDKSCYINNPWQSMLDMLKLISTQLEWSLHTIFANPSRELVWQQLYSLYEQCTQSEVHNLTQVFYGCIVLCFDCLLTYTAKVDPDAFTGTGSGNTSGSTIVLVEGFRSQQESPIDHKKKSTKSESSVHIVAGKDVSGSQEIIQCFQVAVKCWQLLHSVEQLNSETDALLAQWNASGWLWLQSFQIDYSIYQGDFKHAIDLVLGLSPWATPSQGHTMSRSRSELQLASCYYCTKNLSKSCESTLSLVASLPQTTDQPGDLPQLQSTTGRQLQLMTCSPSQIFSYCVHLLITCLKEKAFKSYQGGDVYLGHMIVLLQFDWPRYEPVFTEVVDRVKKKGSFTYNIFFNYVVNIDILEEFAFMKSVEGGKINLDILPLSTKLIAQSRTVTRGVNKGVKEDFKSAMEKQVSRCGEQVENLIRTFFVEEKDTLQKNLL